MFSVQRQINNTNYFIKTSNFISVVFVHSEHSFVMILYMKVKYMFFETFLYALCLVIIDHRAA